VPRRAQDPGRWDAALGNPVWVHCPRCDGAAKIGDGGTLACLKCGHRLGPVRERAERKPSHWVMTRYLEPKCAQCGERVPRGPLPNSAIVDGELVARVKCTNCGHVTEHRAHRTEPPWHLQKPRPEASEPMQLFLKANVGGHVLSANNLAHLEALEAWLGATLRERGPVAGLTWAARLPRWMKAKHARPKVLKALAALRRKAEAAGIG
jgi:DNA-directed RNA polymerase subunit RPC12/RpoP